MAMPKKTKKRKVGRPESGLDWQGHSFRLLPEESRRFSAALKVTKISKAEFTRKATMKLVVDVEKFGAAIVEN